MIWVMLGLFACGEDVNSNEDVEQKDESVEQSDDVGDKGESVTPQPKKTSRPAKNLNEEVFNYLNEKQSEILNQAKNEWNNPAFEKRRNASSDIAAWTKTQEEVRQYIERYTNYQIEFPKERITEKIQVLPVQTVIIPEVKKARAWLAKRDYRLKAVIDSPPVFFAMGCTEEQSDCDDDEKPVHNVQLTKAFYLMESEVTQALYESVMGENPSKFKGSNRPVEMVSWYDAVNFCNKLSKMEGLDQCYTINGSDVSWSNKSCNGWRLPTEAEWEYAARGGQSYKYTGSNNVDEVAWHYGNSGDETHPVGQKKPNGFGLYDMTGNVREWVWDWYGAYSSQSGTDLVGSSSGHYRVERGGGWSCVAWYARVSDRYRNYPGGAGSFLGFRPGRTP